jgi:tetratricopeptide (TPR) repeat protein
MPPRQVQHARLFLHHPQARYVYRVHEQILPQLQKVGRTLQYTDLVIHHLGYSDAMLHHRKALRDLRLVKMDYAMNPEDPTALFNLGITYLRLDNHADGLIYLLKCLKYTKLAEDWVRKLYFSIVTTLAKLGRHAEATTMVLQGLQNFPHDAPLLMELANLSISSGNPSAAEQALKRVLEHRDHKSLGHAIPVEGFDRDARRNLATVYRMQARFTEAEQVLQQLLAEDPEYSWGWLSLGYLYLQRGHHEQVKLTARRMERCPHGEVYALCLLAELAKAEERFQTALDLLQKASAIAPRMLLVKVIQLEALTTMRAPLDDIVLAIHEVQQLEPGNPLARQVMSQIQTTESRQQLYTDLTTSIAVDTSMRLPTS